MTRVKICGIRSQGDLAVALDARADALGFICGTTHVSEDALTPERSRELTRLVPPFVARVLVTHLIDADEILRLAAFIGVDLIQIHGLVDEPTVERVAARFGRHRITKAVHVTGPEAITAALIYAALCHAIHLDARTTERLGGTGIRHDWSISRTIVKRLHAQGTPCILAGGLNPKNVAAAVEVVNPDAVDVNSGVEDSSGGKDACLIKAFISSAVGTERG